MLKQVVILVSSHFYLVFGRSIEKDISHNFHISYIESKYFEKDITYRQDLQYVNNYFGLFVTHSFTISKQRTYPCNECGKIFNAHYNLTRHMPVHTGNFLSIFYNHKSFKKQRSHFSRQDPP